MSTRVRIFGSDIDPKAVATAHELAALPVVEGIALMADAHVGFGPPVGTALVTRNALMPYAVGVDIGCGMIAIQTTLHRRDLTGSEGPIMAAIRHAIPSGVGTSHKAPVTEAHEFMVENGSAPGVGPRSKLQRKGVLLARDHASLMDRALIQFGTLGAGNHFVEVSADVVTGEVWLVLHSGSRGIGNILATAHQQEAKRLAEAHDVVGPRDFAWFPAGFEQYDAYKADLEWAQEYAYWQRGAMMNRLCEAVDAVAPFDMQRVINCHHNYAETDEAGRTVTRKGAISAQLGEWGIIPGSMGTDTYIVTGTGHTPAFNTAPHGAGRAMARGVARRELDVVRFAEQMAGKVWLDRDANALLDEAPDAYKDIHKVIADSHEQVETQHVLSAFINYKGL
jgi:tRNA-splicing ligase RtcB